MEKGLTMSAGVFRKPLCWLGLCETFAAMSDDTGCWGECTICGKRASFVDRATLRAFADAEYEAARAKAEAVKP